MAIGIQEAYENLFNLNKEAQNLSQDEVKNKLKTLTQGQKGDKVIENMARTFKTLCEYADWSDITSTKTPKQTDTTSFQDEELTVQREEDKSQLQVNPIGLHYNIQIHLPETTNMAVCCFPDICFVGLVSSIV